MLIVLRDQRGALRALASAQEIQPTTAPAVAPAGEPPVVTAMQLPRDGATATAGTATVSAADAKVPHVALVERGRIVTIGAVITADWLVILALMVWR